MKKIIVMLVIALLVVSLAYDRTASAEEPLSGGWTPAEDYTVTEERKAVFNKGMAALLGVDYDPLAYLGSQVVAGTNHVFLVKGTAVVPTRPVSYALVYLYQDLQGNVKVLNVADLGIVPNEDGTVAPVEEQLMGGWSYAEDPAVTEEIRTRFYKTLAGMTGISFAPVANLGTQVVAGLNRCLLCQVSQPQPHYALVYVYEDLQGGASISQIIDLDVGAFCTYGA